MYAIEFRANIVDGKIHIPSEYLQTLTADVKIIIFCEDPINQSESTASDKKKSIKGIINHYANPELVKHEKNAWGEAVKEKHDNN